MALVTVVTAVKNAADLLPETIASIQAQTVRDWNYVIVDDGSDDGTAEVVERFAAVDDRIELRRLEESIGPYAAANLGALGATGKYLARIDGDDVAEPERFAAQLGALDASPGARACTGAWRALTSDGPEARVRPVPSKRNGVIKWMMWFRSNLLHSTLLIETSFFDELGGYGPERIGEDFRMWAEIVRAGVLAVTDAPLVLYRMSAGQMTAVEGARDQPERLRISLDHMQRCALGHWTLDDARDIRWIGSDAPFPPARALALLGRFEQAWRADPALDDADRRELARHTATRRLRHLRHALKARPAAVSLASVRSAPAVLRSFVAAATNRGAPWP